MENPYEGQNYRPYTPPPVYEPESAPNSSVYQGNATFATLSLVMGILSILSICCFSPMVFVFSGLGILFSCLSKGEHRRPGNAKAGMAICVSCLTIFTALVIFICTFFLVSDKGQSFLQEYYHLITSDNVTEADLYNFIYKYMYGEDFLPYPDTDSYDTPNGYDNYDNYDDYFNDDGGYDFYDGDLPDFYQPQPDTGSDVI